jgi:hypothetical protein
MTSEPAVRHVAFIGHIGLDDVVPIEGSSRVAPGSAVLRGAPAAVNVGPRINSRSRDDRHSRATLSVRRP